MADCARPCLGRRSPEWESSAQGQASLHEPHEGAENGFNDESDDAPMNFASGRSPGPGEHSHSQGIPHGDGLHGNPESGEEHAERPPWGLPLGSPDIQGDMVEDGYWYEDDEMGGGLGGQWEHTMILGPSMMGMVGVGPHGMMPGMDLGYDDGVMMGFPHSMLDVIAEEEGEEDGSEPEDSPSKAGGAAEGMAARQIDAESPRAGSDHGAAALPAIDSPASCRSEQTVSTATRAINSTLEDVLGSISGMDAPLRKSASSTGASPDEEQGGSGSPRAPEGLSSTSVDESRPEPEEGASSETAELLVEPQPINHSLPASPDEEGVQAKPATTAAPAEDQPQPLHSGGEPTPDADALPGEQVTEAIPVLSAGPAEAASNSTEADLRAKVKVRRSTPPSPSAIWITAWIIRDRWSHSLNIYRCFRLLRPTRLACFTSSLRPSFLHFLPPSSFLLSSLSLSLSLSVLRVFANPSRLLHHPFLLPPPKSLPLPHSVPMAHSDPVCVPLSQSPVDHSCYALP